MAKKPIAATNEVLCTTVIMLRAAVAVYATAQTTMNRKFSEFFAKCVTPEVKAVLWAAVLKTVRTVGGTELSKAELPENVKREYTNMVTAKSRYEASIRKAAAEPEEKKSFIGQRIANAERDMLMVQKLSPEKAGNRDVPRLLAQYRALIAELRK